MEFKASSKLGVPRARINKRGRIIIRNISFKATEDIIQNWFSTYGEIEDVKLLRKPDGSLVGCGFVQFKAVPSAAKAIKECNAKPFLGRPIAVDWAIPKEQYAAANNKPQPIGEEQSTLANNNDTVEDTQNEALKEERSTVKNSIIKFEENSETDPDAESDGDSAMNSDDESEAHQDTDSDADEHVNLKPKQKSMKNQVAEGNDWKGHNAESERKSDVGEGKTLFIRNLDFSTTQDSLRNFMEQFGPIEYALLCMDKVMERPKGTGFVKFKEADSAQKCLEEFRASSLLLDGRVLDIAIAVTREDLERKKKEEKNNEHKDKRNLFLAREGFIRPGTLAAQGVSPTDMAKRQQNEMWKKQMLKNLHMFISRERLCVHNLPPKMTDKQLANLFKSNSSESAKIVEARIMRDFKVLGEGNIHPSKGYGFVTFTKHEDALLALRNINNNPNIFTKDKRPIVEFSVENRAAVKAKIQRTQKSLENLKQGKNSQSLPDYSATSEVPVPKFSGAKADPKIKKLPSHAGPKIRHRKRPSPPDVEGVAAKKPKIRRKMFKNPDSRKTQAKKTSQGSSQISKLKKSKSVKETSSKPAGKRSKWFDT